MRRYTVAQAANRLQRHPELVRRWLREGRLRGEKFARDWLIMEAELHRFQKQAPQKRRR